MWVNISALYALKLLALEVRYIATLRKLSSVVHPSRLHRDMLFMKFVPDVILHGKVNKARPWISHSEVSFNTFILFKLWLRLMRIIFISFSHFASCSHTRTILTRLRAVFGLQPNSAQNLDWNVVHFLICRYLSVQFA